MTKALFVAQMELKPEVAAADVEKFWVEVEQMVSKTVMCLWSYLWGSHCKFFPEAHTWRVNEERGLPHLSAQTSMPGSACFHVFLVYSTDNLM